MTQQLSSTGINYTNATLCGCWCFQQLLRTTEFISYFYYNNYCVCYLQHATFTLATGAGLFHCCVWLCSTAFVSASTSLNSEIAAPATTDLPAQPQQLQIQVHKIYCASSSLSISTYLIINLTPNEAFDQANHHNCCSTTNHT